METNRGNQNSSAGDDQCVPIVRVRAGFFDYYHIPTMKKLFSIEEAENSLHCCDFDPTG